MSEIGKKDDGGKPQWHLAQWDALEEYVRVLGFGAQKYSAENWRKVEPLRERYLDALQRHLVEYARARREGRPPLDPESGLHILAHALCDCAFVLQIDLEEARFGKQPGA